MLDYRLQRRIIAELETKGVSRRSAPSRESAAQMVTTYERVAGSGGATSGPRKLTPGESRYSRRKARQPFLSDQLKRE
jgi:hypothetical protein